MNKKEYILFLWNFNFSGGIVDYSSNQLIFINIMRKVCVKKKGGGACIIKKMKLMILKERFI
jgi:hypothetical protein